MRSNEKYKYSIPNLNELLSERNPSSTYTVQVKNETLNSEVSFNKFLLEWSSDGKSAWVQDVEKASESVHKGAGISAYKILGEELAKNGVVFHPSEELYDDGYNLWKQLKREGRAGKNDVANRYSYIPKDNFKSFESLPTNPWETSSLSGVSGDKLDLVRTSTHLNRWSSDGNGSLIITPKEDTEFFSRSTTHFTLNSVVQDHGNNTFSTGKFAVIGSLQDAAKDNIVSGLSPVDTWMLPSEGKISIPNATLIAPDNIEIPERFSGLNVLKYAADEDQKINYSNLTEAIKVELGKRNSPYYEAGAYGWVGKDSATKEEQLKISKLLGSAVALPSIHFASPDENMEELISDTLKLKNYLKEDNFSVNDLPPNQQLFEAKERFNDDLKQVHPKAQSLHRDKFNKAFERTKEELDLWTDKKYPKESVSKLPEGFPLPNGSSTAIPPPISSSVIPLTPSGNVPGMPPIPGNSIPPPIPINMEVDTPLDMVGKSSPFNPSISTLKKQYPTEIINALSNTTHQAVDTTKVSGVNTKTSTISNHKKVHKDVEENSVKNFFGANRLKSFDTETTGLNTTHQQLSKRDRIWQVGLAIEGIGGVEEHTNPFFTSNNEGKLEQSVKMSRPYLESSLKHSNGRFSKKAFEDGNFNQFMSMYEKGELSSLETSLNNTLGNINLNDVVVLQNMNFENKMLKSSLDQGLISKEHYESIAKRMETVSVDLEGNTQTLFQRPHKVQKLMRQADMMYHTEYLNNLSEDSFQQYRSTVNNAIAEYTSSINNKNRVGAVAVELQDLSKAFLANAANRGLIDKQTATLGLNVDFLSRAILGTSEKHTALKDSEDTISLFKKMWEMNSDLNSGAELSENTLKVLNNIKEQQPEEINKRFISTVRSVINDFKEKNYTKIGDNLTWYTPEISLRQQVNDGSVIEKLDKISVSQKEKEYNLPKALDNVISRYNKYTDNIGGFDRKNYVNNIVNDFNSGASFQGIHTKVDNDYFNLKTEPTSSTESIINKEINNSMNNSDNFWSKKTELFGKEMKMKTKATILGGIGAGLATMAFTQRPHPQDERYSNVSEQFYDEQYLGTAFVDFKERNKHYMM